MNKKKRYRKFLHLKDKMNVLSKKIFAIDHSMINAKKIFFMISMTVNFIILNFGN